MTNFKSVTNLPLVESAEGLNLIVNDNGAAKQIAASAVGAQADWAETNENSPAFIKNKPTVNSNTEFDVDIKAIYAMKEGLSDPYVSTYTVQYLNSFENIKNKFFEAGVLPKAIIKAFVPHPDHPSVYGITTFMPLETKYVPGILAGEEDAPDAIVFLLGGVDGEHVITLTPDGELFYDYPQFTPPVQPS